jgi:predicted ester cyclase
MVAAAAYFAEDTRNHGQPVGRVGVLAVLNDIRTTFPDVRFKPTDFVAEDEWVVMRGTFGGTHQGIGRIPVSGGMLVGVRPTGRHFDVQHIHMFQVRDGKIVEHFAYRRRSSDDAAAWFDSNADPR